MKIQQWILSSLIGLIGIFLLGALPSAETEIVPDEADRYYVGKDRCLSCHRDLGTGKAPRNWHESQHALAYLTLAKEESKAISKLSGIDTDPFSSPVCLKCHTTASDSEDWERDEAFRFEDGIQCESCHGPGSEYAEKGIMADRNRAIRSGLILPDRDTCVVCHISKGSHDAILKQRPFDADRFYREIAHGGGQVREDIAVTENERFRLKRSEDWHRLNRLYKQYKEKSTQTDPRKIEYKTPYHLAISNDDKTLYVACESADSVIIIDLKSRKKTAEIQVQNQPHGLCLSPNEQILYVSNRGSDSVTAIDTESRKVRFHMTVGDEPHGLDTDQAGRFLYVTNAGSEDISVIDLAKKREIKRLAAGRGTWDVHCAPDGKQLYVSNNLSHFVPFRTPSVSEMTVVKTGNATVSDRIMLKGANLVQGIAFAPDGEFALTTLIRTKNLIPITRINRGWVITNGIGIIWKNGKHDQLLLDRLGDYFADPTDVIISPNKKYAFVSGGGIDAVAVIDLEQMKAVISRFSDRDRREVMPNHLGISHEYVVKRIPVGKSPRGLAVSKDSRHVYVANGLDDTVSVIDIEQLEVSHTIDLGGPKEMTRVRFGEQVFHSARATFGNQFSCHTCHPDGGIDAITYDLEPDGLGINPVDNRTLKGILDTAPFKWTGKNKSLQRQCGPRLAVFFTRIDPFTPDQVTALESYICTIPRNPNRFRKPGGLTAAQLRGKRLFNRVRDNFGQIIPKEGRCIHCHSGPYFTNRKKFDVGTQSHLDTKILFDTPHLNNIYESAPYLHDGRAETLEEIWTRFNPDDKHGITNDMTKDQLNDLIEYLKTL